MSKNASFITKYILSKPLWVNFIYGVLLFLIFILIFYFSLKSITKYGQQNIVPNVIGLQLNEAQDTLNKYGFKYEIFDSIYEFDKAAEMILKQDPENPEIVKAGRKVFLTINRHNPPLVTLPNLIGFSLESVTQYLQTLSLKIEKVTFIDNPTFNLILNIKINGRIIQENEKVKAGTGLELLVGNGFRNIEVEVPNLIGLNLNTALQKLKELNLFIGNIDATSILIDTLSAFVIGQNPYYLQKIIDSNEQEKIVPNKIKTFNPINVRINSSPFAEDTFKF